MIMTMMILIIITTMTLIIMMMMILIIIMKMIMMMMMINAYNTLHRLTSIVIKIRDSEFILNNFNRITILNQVSKLSYCLAQFLHYTSY